MKQYLTQIGISTLISFISVFIFYNYLPFQIDSLTGNGMVGSTITTINGSDTLKDSRSVINTNFTNLNSDKMEWSSWFATTSAPQITTMSALATIGTIISGIWHGTVVEALYGGTGWGSIRPYSILLGNGTSKLATTTPGTDGQLLTYSSSSAPYWASPSVDTTIPYSWTGYHTFANAGFTNATGTTQNFTGVSTLETVNANSLSFSSLATTTVIFGNFTATSSLISSTWTETITTGWTPRYIEINYYIQGFNGDSGNYRQNMGMATYNMGLANVYSYSIDGDNGSDNSNLQVCGSGYLSVMGKPGSPGTSVGVIGAGNGGFTTEISVSATSTTGFTLSGTFTKGASASGHPGRFQGQYKVYR